MEEKDHIPAEAKNFYHNSKWFSDSEGCQRGKVNGFCLLVGEDSLDYKEILTPEISETLEDKQDSIRTRNGVNGIPDDGGRGNGELDPQILSSEIVEVIEDRRVDDIYVAVGKDDLDVVKWVLDHAVSPGARIFLIHVSPPITMIPTPVGKLPRRQLISQQVRIYLNEENLRRKNLLQKYIQLSTDAEVTAESLLLESDDIGKAILEVISVLNITNLVIGIKKPSHLRGKNKLTKGEFVKKNAPESCKVTLVYNGKEVVTNGNMDVLVSRCQVSQSGGHRKRNFFRCMCLSGCMNEVKD